MSSSAHVRLRRASHPRLRSARRVVTDTVAACFRYRVTGLAAEAGFFALLSLPPLLLGLVGALGFVIRPLLGDAVVEEVRLSIIEAAATALNTDTVTKVITETFDDVTSDGRIDLISVGFALAVWSGSRALNVYIDTVTIMYGLGGHRGIVRTRALSVTLYILALLVGSVALPLVVAGPGLVADALPQRFDPWVQATYWPSVLLLCVLFLATLYHVAVPVRSPWRRDLPGAVLAVALWLALSWVLRTVISASVGGTSIYGPLSAPIVVLVWLYMLAISVLIGAAFNAALNNLLKERGERDVVVDPALEKAEEKVKQKAATSAKPKMGVIAPEPATAAPGDQPHEPQQPDEGPRRNPLTPVPNDR